MSRRFQSELQFPNGWGGRRPGAGRKSGLNPRVRHRSRERFASRHPCHVTFRVRKDVPSLRTVRFVREFEQSLREIRARRGFRVVHYSILGNHVHMVVEAMGPEALGKGKAESPGTAADLPAVAQPHTWLVQKGWRRHGLIGLGGVPAGAR